MTDNKIIEINGVKFEVDARTATLRQLDHIKIGSRVKVLIPGYSDSVEVHHGAVVGFEPFQNSPTIIIAYLKTSYGTAAEIKFLYFNSKSKEQIIVSDENDKEALEASNIVAAMDKEIVKKKNEIQDLEDRKAYFLQNFKAYWNTLVMPAPSKDEAVIN
jgi:CRISPR/Cas system-associated exonuclease Cas4 (RecB family)